MILLIFRGYGLEVTEKFDALSGEDPIQTSRDVVQEELFWRERQQKLRALSGLQASTSCHTVVASSIAPPAYRPLILQTQHLDKGVKLHEVRVVRQPLSKI